MRIAFLTSLDVLKLSTGAEASAYRLARELSLREHDVHIFHGYAEKTSMTTVGNLVIHSSAHNMHRNIAAYLSNRAVYRSFQKENSLKQFDIVNLVGAGLALAARKISGIPIVYEALDVFQRELYSLPFREKLRNVPYYIVIIPLDKIAMRIASAVFVLTNSGLEERVEFFPSFENKMHIVPLALPTQWFDTIPKCFEERARDYTFVYVGSNRRKFSIFLQALSILKSDGFNVKGVALREYDREATAQTRMIGLDVLFPGYVDESVLFDIYGKAIALVLPSVREGFCVPIIECASQGTPSIVSSIPAVTDFVEDGINGLVIHDFDPSSWAFAMKKLMFNAALWHDLSYAAKEKSKMYDTKQIATRVEHIYKQLLAQKP